LYGIFCKSLKKKKRIILKKKPKVGFLVSTDVHTNMHSS
jgi:hypothetical protein